MHRVVVRLTLFDMFDNFIIIIIIVLILIFTSYKLIGSERLTDPEHRESKSSFLVVRYVSLSEIA